MGILETIADAWGWKGIDPTAVIDINPFGNVIVETSSGDFWRICPEELSATRLADSNAELETVFQNPEFLTDWDMAQLAQEAEDAFGIPPEDRCYCLKMPGALGGKYEHSNLATISIIELLSVSGSLAKQIGDVPDGGKVRLIVKKPN